jgi:hypothetical protein
MSAGLLRSPDRVTLVAPLGVRFRDVVSGASVGDGLAVRGRALAPDSPWRQAAPSLTGTYVFHGLPGLGTAQRGEGDEEFWRHWGAAADFLVEVRDLRGRYQPFSFEAAAPWRGFFSPPCLVGSLASPLSPASPPDDEQVPLFPTTAYPPDGLNAVVRAELWDPDLRRPAAWAVLEVTDPDGTVARGVSDVDGRVVVFLPVPSPFAPGTEAASTFSATSSLPLGKRTFPLSLRFRYEALDPTRSSPDLCAVLGQSPATAWADQGRTAELAEERLEPGRDLILRTSAAGLPLSTVHITPTGSPP